FRLPTRLKIEDVRLPLLDQREVKTVGILVISGDRGLCGAYNTNIIRRAENRAQELKEKGLDYQFFLIGRKAVQYFSRRKQPIAASFTNLSQIPSASESANIATQFTDSFLTGKIDRLELVYTRFISLISSQPVIQTLLPLEPQGLEPKDDEIFRLIIAGGKFTVQRQALETTVTDVPRDMIFEQDPVQLLDALLPLYVNYQLLRALQESVASELASRMTAMSNASDNASELAKVLTLSYNKARQAAITQEILEVVAGSSAS
ncbi:MAG: ATP synthase F1 subunit gamma, partial [Cyanobacteria bacterium KgW148]|nr:ATP synthase F1 subunit gamma [Cyanobacteria bacterium KgW148]